MRCCGRGEELQRLCRQGVVARAYRLSCLRNFASMEVRTVVTWIQWLLSCFLLVFPVRAQFPPPIPSDNMTTVHSPVNGNITITFKTPPVGTCTTVFATQKQYSGYITLPPNVLSPSQGNYTINTFFWFFEARQQPDSAGLTIWINGGPGSSSMIGLFQEIGPCQVVELSKDKLGTQAREWGWDRSSNLIFIDQPVQVGFSYDILTNASLNLIDDVLSYPPSSVPVSQPPYTFLNGTFASGNPMFSANTSQVAAKSIWHFLQGFLGAFPQYNPMLRNSSSGAGAGGINLFTESYGGKYGPAIASFFESQNMLRLTDPIMANNTLEISLATLGIMNGWIDLFVQTPMYPRFAYNNTYGISTITQVQELNALSAYASANGCEQMANTCRAQEAALDDGDEGDVATVNDICSQAQQYCQEDVIDPYTFAGRSVYDISQGYLDPFPGNHYLEYLNNIAVQEAIGTPVNYTQDSLAVYSAFNATGDYARDGVLDDIVNLLESGVRVALIYGDRDYICNWVGGEAVSFAIAGAAQPKYAEWYSSGYSPIVANSSYVGGVVREYGNLSFSRVYDAGHLVPAYQPETAFTIFSRVIEGTQIGLGSLIDLSTFGSSGEVNATQTNSAPPMASPTCFIRAVNTTCNLDQRNMLANRAGVIINGVLYDSEGDWVPPAASLSSIVGLPGTAPASMMPSAPISTGSTGSSNSSKGTMKATTSLPTGVYTATGVPETSSTATRNLAEKGFHASPELQQSLILGALALGLLCS